MGGAIRSNGCLLGDGASDISPWSGALSLYLKGYGPPVFRDSERMASDVSWRRPGQPLSLENVFVTLRKPILFWKLRPLGS